MKIDRYWQNEWFAFNMDQELFHLGNCGDYDAAEEIAADVLDPKTVWFLIDGKMANSWVETIAKGFSEADTHNI